MHTGPDDTNRLDPAAAMVAVLACIHCLVARWLPPVIGGESAHLIVALVVSGFSMAVLWAGWTRHHEVRVWIWASSGWLGLLLARAGSGSGLNEGGEIVVTLVSCGLLVTAHFLNRSLAYWNQRY